MSYDDLISSGMVARTNLDNMRWWLGDLANAAADYGVTIARYAGDIGMKDDSLRCYARLSSFYPQLVRESYEDTNITWSHMREAKRIGNLDIACQWLTRASSEGWSVSKLAVEMDKHYEGVFPLWRQVDVIEGDLFTLQIYLTKCQSNRHYKMILSELYQEEIA